MQASMGGAEIDNLFRALGDPTRRVIIERLAECPASVSELTEPFDMSLPAIYQHLRILREAGLVQTVKSGRIRTCSLDVRVLRRAEQWLTQRRAMWDRRLDALAEHLAREGKKSVVKMTAIRTRPEDSILRVRRSIHLNASPNRVWAEFSSFERMNAWWGNVREEPLAGTSNGQWLDAYEPRVGGWIQMAVKWHGSRVAYGGGIVRFDPGRELTFENDWIPNNGWHEPTLITFRLTSALGGTIVELFHHHFERTGTDASSTHAGYEQGWGMMQLLELKRIVEATA